MTYGALRIKVSNRGRPPVAFLDELIAWGRTAAPEIFAPNAAQDIYASVREVLGPWRGDLQRRAVMLEVMRVLAGFESSWDWNAGRDVTNPTSVTATTTEAGAWQVSANSIGFGADLRQLVIGRVGTADGTRFQAAMKSDHALAMEYIARLLRHTVNHNGPVKRHEIDPWLSSEAVEELIGLLEPT